MAIKLRICSYCLCFKLSCKVDRGIGLFCVAITVYCMQFMNVACALLDDWVTVIQCLQLIVQWVFKCFMSFLLKVIVTLYHYVNKYIYVVIYKPYYVLFVCYSNKLNRKISNTKLRTILYLQFNNVYKIKISSQRNYAYQVHKYYRHNMYK